jgi:hypothetical protein
VAFNDKVATSAALSSWRIGIIYLEQARTGGSAERADLPPSPVTLHIK